MMGLMGRLGLLGLLGLLGCSEEGDGGAGETATIVAQQCTRGFAEQGDAASTRGFAEQGDAASARGFAERETVTRTWAPPSPYVEYGSIYGTNGMFAIQKNLVNKSIDAFFTKDGAEPQEGIFFYKESDTSWYLNMKDLTEGSYQVYGYIPKEDAETATIAPNGGSYDNGAVLTINGLNSVTSSDVCVIVGAKDDKDYNPATNNYTVTGLAPGRFGVNFSSGTNATNHVFLLFDHLYAALRFNFKVDTTYHALRTIKLRKLELTAYADDGGGGVKSKFNATITLKQNGTGTSPITDVVYTANASSADAAAVILYQWDGTKNTTEDTDNEVILDPTEPTRFMGCFVPGMNTYFKLRSTYDVFDKQENLIRQGCQAENTIDLRQHFGDKLTTMRGNRYSLTLTVQPTYLYMLSEPDLDNPKVKLE